MPVAEPLSRIAQSRRWAADWQRRSLALRTASFISHAASGATVCDSYGETLAYVYSILHSRPGEPLYKWVLRMRGDLKPCTSWLLLAAVADLLSILRIASVTLQPQNLRAHGGAHR